MSVFEIRSAIEAELAATPEYYDFKVMRSAREGAVWRVTIQPGAAYAEGQYANVVLDDSFEGAKAWWRGPPKGGADVLAVLAEEDELILQHATTAPPGPNDLIRLYPPRYLQALIDGWRDPIWAGCAFGELADLSSPSRIEANPLSGHRFSWLRRAQRRALKLISYTSAFLWGPPGTGKTTTLGVILAEFLHVNPRARVLLMSTTNHAVDQATIAVDKALEQAGRVYLRDRVKRIGTHFNASQYVNRMHLLPVRDDDLIMRLVIAERDRPSTSDVQAYSLWAQHIEALQAELRRKALDVLRDARLAAMTTTRAAFTLKDLRELPRFDLVVFDEASQVGLAHALLFMPLGKARFFAGDPQQLSPVVRSPARNAQRWLARSAFSEKPTGVPSVCMLDEQSRMAQPISDLVSHLFYDGSLRVAPDALTSDDWRERRSLTIATFEPAQHVCLVPMSEEGTWSGHYRGPIRFCSAAWIAEFLSEAMEKNQVREEDVIVLTPFRAQRALIRAQLSKLGIRKIKVSTVHRAQGSEAPVVVFDPAIGSSDFLKTDEAARLINVAISRAQAKFVIALSAGDRENPWFDRIYHREQLESDTREPVPLETLLSRGDFPACAIGELISISRHSGVVTRISPTGDRLYLRNRFTGAEQEFDLNHIKKMVNPTTG